MILIDRVGYLYRNLKPIVFLFLAILISIQRIRIRYILTEEMPQNCIYKGWLVFALHGWIVPPDIYGGIQKSQLTNYMQRDGTEKSI